MKHYRYSYTRCFGLAVAGSLLIFLMLGTIGSASAQTLPLIGYCKYCSSNAAFANAAVQAAPDAAPGNGTPVTYPVYVINPANGIIQFFNVLVWYDWGDGYPESVDPGDAKTSTAESGGTIQHHGLHKEAYPGTGDSNVISAMQAAHTAVWQFFSPANMQVNSGDVPGAPDSAVDLVGPENGPAGYNRLNLENGLRNVNSGVWASVQAGLNDIASRLSNRFAGSSNYVTGNPVLTVSFPDGTKIDVEFEEISDGPGGIVFKMKVRPESAVLPNGQSLPQMPGQFEGFDYSGGTSVIDAIRDLAFRYGIPITGSGGSRLACTRIDGGALTCQMLPH